MRPRTHHVGPPQTLTPLVERMTSEALADPEAYFEKYARYDPRNGRPYSIIWRGYGFTSEDTMDLARRFRRAVSRFRRKLAGHPMERPARVE